MNNKGFTMIELLAAVLILGILATVALPNVFRIMTDSKADKYIDDAKKLISNADYKMRINSAYITKPASGRCIAMTMSYLDGPEFDTAPEGGQYNREYSYVLIKAVDGKGKYEYTVSLVEDVKAGKTDKSGKVIESTKSSFKGITLAKQADLKKRSARSLVEGIPKDVIKLYNEGGCTVSNLYSLDPDEAEKRPGT